MHGQIDPVPHGLDIRAVVELHLNAGDGKRFHGVTVSRTSPGDR